MGFPLVKVEEVDKETYKRIENLIFPLREKAKFVIEKERETYKI